MPLSNSNLFLHALHKISILTLGLTALLRLTEKMPFWPRKNDLELGGLGSKNNWGGLVGGIKVASHYESCLCFCLTTKPLWLALWISPIVMFGTTLRLNHKRMFHQALLSFYSDSDTSVCRNFFWYIDMFPYFYFEPSAFKSTNTNYQIGEGWTLFHCQREKFMEKTIIILYTSCMHFFKMLKTLKKERNEYYQKVKKTPLLSHE